MYQASLGFFSAAPVWYKNNIFRQLRNRLYFCPFLWFTYLMTTKKNATIYLGFCITKIWQILVSTFLFHLIWKNYVLCLDFDFKKSQIVDFFTHFNHWKKCHKQFFISSKYHRRKIIISTFLKCFTLHWLEYLVHFFTLSTNDDIKTPIFIARIYCIGSFFKPKKKSFFTFHEVSPNEHYLLCNGNASRNDLQSSSNNNVDASKFQILFRILS